MIKLTYNSINNTYLVLINQYEEISKGCFVIKSQKIKEVSREFFNFYLERDDNFSEIWKN